MQSDSPPAAAPPVLELSRVVKSFGAVVALRSGSLRMQSGSIHALIGENGAERLDDPGELQHGGRCGRRDVRLHEFLLVEGEFGSESIQGRFRATLWTDG